MQVIAVTGTPGSGKSLVVDKLKKRLQKCDKEYHVKVVNVSELVRKEKLYSQYDDHLDACVMSSKLVARRLKQMIEECGSKKPTNTIVLIETHTPSILPKDKVDKCLVLQCDTCIIYDRLVDRAYSKRKIDENVQAEIMQVCKEDAVERLGSDRVVCCPNNNLKELKALLIFCSYPYINSS